MYTISRSDVVRVVYDDGSEDVFEERERARNRFTLPLPRLSTQTPDTPQEPAIVYIRRNEEYNNYDTCFIYTDGDCNNFQRFFRNYSATLGYSALLRANALMNINWALHIRNYREGTSRSGDFYTLGVGLGLAQRGVLALAMDMRRSLWRFDEFDIFGGLNYQLSLWFGMEVAPTIDFRHKQWLFSVGPSFFINWNSDEYYVANDRGISLALNASYFIDEFNVPVIDVIRHRKPERRKRYFRPGIEVNYPLYRSEMEFWENEFPYLSFGAGLFLRIGPEPIYFTTGIYGKVEGEWREDIVSRDLRIFGVNVPNIPLPDDTRLFWNKGSVEIPLLFNYATAGEQVRFIGGALLEFTTSSYLYFYNEKIDLRGTIG
jgi:hypothetical protein